MFIYQNWIRGKYNNNSTLKTEILSEGILGGRGGEFRAEETERKRQFLLKRPSRMYTLNQREIKAIRRNVDQSSTCSVAPHTIFSWALDIPGFRWDRLYCNMSSWRIKVFPFFCDTYILPYIYGVSTFLVFIIVYIYYYIVMLWYLSVFRSNKINEQNWWRNTTSLIWKLRCAEEMGKKNTKHTQIFGMEKVNKYREKSIFFLPLFHE